MSAERAREVVAAVPDPEIPVLTIDDLGILRDVAVDGGGRVVVTITPTYSGCPAMDVIRERIAERLLQHGFERSEVKTVLAPAWTTDWMSEAGRRKLREYGIAPPTADRGVAEVRCPRCGSSNVRELSRFGATACQAQFACQACLEPFDRFKPH
ncbi:MAG TPA: 1,2-phenylacetyl-CoA epoxidase subunit PaaD [Solirubrobacterales bacterium]|nr:1,2-phenylacetyl-CoA epoxidase subunit PaaD [Solirubrobacterales bacterium]